MGEVVQHHDTNSSDSLWMKGWFDKYKRAQRDTMKYSSLTQFGQHLISIHGSTSPVTDSRQGNGVSRSDIMGVDDR